MKNITPPQFLNIVLLICILWTLLITGRNVRRLEDKLSEINRALIIAEK